MTLGDGTTQMTVYKATSTDGPTIEIQNQGGGPSRTKVRYGSPSTQP